MKAIERVIKERDRQDKKWGGSDHDDNHAPAFWAQIIQDYAGWARVMAGMDNLVKARNRFVQVAALAIAAIEVIDRGLERQLDAKKDAARADLAQKTTPVMASDPALEGPRKSRPPRGRQIRRMRVGPLSNSGD